MGMHRYESQIAVIVPCFNEEIAVAKVVGDARRFLPEAEVYVFDNGSSDQTAARAHAAGAIVVHSPLKGKGQVVRHAFREVEAEMYVLIDGDDTYPLEQVRDLIDLVVDRNYAMAVGTRMDKHQKGSFPSGHVFGNRVFSFLVSRLFGQPISDMLSGYRVLSRDLVDQLRLSSTGFEIETDLTLQAISKGFSICERPISYRVRAAGSVSKLNKFRDGFYILKFIFKLVKDYRPLPFFGGASLLCFFLSLTSGWQPVLDYLTFAYVYTVPRAILAASLMVLSFMFLGIGLILDAQIRAFNDQMAILHRLLRPTKSRQHFPRRAA
jgi:glycosyltransferase involved in cell wall biosynthesis